ncbi:MAG: phosphatidylserine decarboxylase family protein [bacterium]|nr:phosphatidylserine decarboxylase family protein [bacterium]
MGVTKHGLSVLIPILLITIVLWMIARIHSGWWWAGFGIFLLFFLFSLWFFRDPYRKISDDPLTIVSPADGKVIEIAKEQSDPFIKEPVLRISIFLSVFDVHVNRNITDGIVHSIERSKGKYLVAYHPRAMYENHRLRVNVISDYGKVAYTQVTGAIARRIVCTLKEGQKVKKGERYGMIRFGSRMDIFLPMEKVDVQIQEKEKVKGGATILARWKNS